MTNEERRTADIFLEMITTYESIWVSPEQREALAAYRTEHERMRQFIRNLADESRVYLESEK